MADTATAAASPVALPKPESGGVDRTTLLVFAGLGVVLLVAPFLLYPVFLMKVLCFALFACAFTLPLGSGAPLPFGPAPYLGMATYVAASTAKFWGITP